MQDVAETTVARPRAEVFDHLARAEWLPQYVSEFAWVRKVSEGPATEGTEYAYKLRRGGAEGTFAWTEFERPSRLAWRGPPVKARLGSMAPAGRWELSDVGHATYVKLVMEPEAGGLYRLTGPLMSRLMGKSNREALWRLKQRLEGSAPVSPRNDRVRERGAHATSAG